LQLGSAWHGARKAVPGRYTFKCLDTANANSDMLPRKAVQYDILLKSLDTVSDASSLAAALLCCRPAGTVVLSFAKTLQLWPVRYTLAVAKSRCNLAEQQMQLGRKRNQCVIFMAGHGITCSLAVAL
jgi:hypothetical protein